MSLPEGDASFTVEPGMFIRPDPGARRKRGERVGKAVEGGIDKLVSGIGNVFIGSPRGQNSPKKEKNVSMMPSFEGTPEETLMHFFQKEKSARKSKTSQLTLQLADLFEALPDEAVARCRAALDSNLLFRTDGSLCDLRSLVFDDLEQADAKRIFARIQAACKRPDREKQGLVVLTDVDDTLLPGSDSLKISGSDRSWALDGQLYPGVSKLHHELRNNLREEFGGDYSVLLTARPPALVRSLGAKFQRLTGVRKPRMAILPGEGGVQMGLNTIRVLTGNYTRLGETKVARMKEYALLFPDYAGRFVFIGDDGQADLAAAEQMLDIRVSQIAALRESAAASSSSGGRGARMGAGTPEDRLKFDLPIVAFVAIKACFRQAGQESVPKEQRDMTTMRVRSIHRPVHEIHSAVEPANGGSRDRFFYFADYMDLAEQLGAAGWISNDSRDRVQKAVVRDSVPQPADMVRAVDLEGLEMALENKKKHSIEEADEQELEAFASAQVSLAAVASAHLHIGAPPENASHLVLKATFVEVHKRDWPSTSSPKTDSSSGGLTPTSPRGGGTPAAPLSPRMASRDLDTPRLTVWDAASKSSSIQTHEVIGDGELRLPWPCDAVFSRNGRPALDVAYGLHVGRCYLLAKDEPSYGHSAGERAKGEADIASAMLIGFDSSGPDLSVCAGHVKIKVTWIAGDATVWA